VGDSDNGSASLVGELFSQGSVGDGEITLDHDGVRLPRKELEVPRGRIGLGEVEYSRSVLLTKVP
jgi:hypothetical protein